MRTLKLTHEQIELITNSLTQSYNSQIRIVSENSKILSESVRQEIINSANQFDVLLSEINNGNLDI